MGGEGILWELWEFMGGMCEMGELGRVSFHLPFGEAGRGPREGPSYIPSISLILSTDIFIFS